MPINAVDVNCDLGESFGCWRLGDSEDRLLMDFISSANIATGFHAGDPNLINETIKMAAERGIGIGAHPGYRDLYGFGRRRINASSEELVNDIIYQVGALKEFTRRHDAHFQHVKPHGALYMEMAVNADLATVFMDYMQCVAPDAFVFCMPNSEMAKAAQAAGQPIIREFYADRDYSDSGSIVFTRNVGKLDPAKVAAKVVRACLEGKVRTVEGNELNIEFDSVCFHSDTPGCFSIGQQMRQALLEHHIQITPASRLAQQRSQENPHG